MSISLPYFSQENQRQKQAVAPPTVPEPENEPLEMEEEPTEVTSPIESPPYAMSPGVEYKKYREKQSFKITERLNKNVLRAWSDLGSSGRVRSLSRSPSLQSLTGITKETLPTSLSSTRVPQKKRPSTAGGYYQSRKSYPSKSSKSPTLKPKRIMVSLEPDSPLAKYKNSHL